MERAVPVLPVNDLTAARTFYVDGLGFEVSFEATEDGKSGLLGVRRGAIAITLDSPMDGHGRDACVSLEVESADRYYEEWRTRSARETPTEKRGMGWSHFRRHGPVREHHLRCWTARVTDQGGNHDCATAISAD